MSPNIFKDTDIQKIPANILQTLLRKAARTDLISFLFRKRKCDKPQHQEKTVYHLMHKTNKISLPVLLQENHKSIRKADEKIK